MSIPITGITLGTSSSTIPDRHIVNTEWSLSDGVPHDDALRGSLVPDMVEQHHLFSLAIAEARGPVRPCSDNNSQCDVCGRPLYRLGGLSEYAPSRRQRQSDLINSFQRRGCFTRSKPCGQERFVIWGVRRSSTYLLRLRTGTPV